jgi:ribosome-associated toxin RatA of RatAB toxin-antitoxin module
LPELTLEATVDAPADAAYALAKDFSAYRRYMREIHQVDVVAEGPGWQETEWRVVRLGQVYGWRERDVFDDTERVIRSELVSSPFLDVLRLETRFLAEGPERTRIRAHVTFRARFATQIVEGLAIPLLRRNFQALTEGLRRRLTGEGAADGPEGRVEVL